MPLDRAHILAALPTRRCTRALLPLALMFLLGCGLLLGRKWEPERFPSSMALIYVYGMDVATGQHVYLERDPRGELPQADDQILLIDSGYYPYALRPGSVRAWTGGGAGDPYTCLTFEVRAGQSYYLRAAGEGNQLKLLTGNAAEREIGSTRRLSSEHRGKPSSSSFGADDKPRCKAVEPL